MSELRAYEPDEELDQLEGQDVPMLDDMDAEYMLTLIRQADTEYQKMESWYAHMVEKAKEKRDRKVAWAENNLRAYFDIVPAKVTKTQKTYDLPSGKLVLKHQEPKYTTKDEELVPWLKKNGKAGLVKVKEEADWANLKKQLKASPDGLSMVTEDGEIVPGITVTPREDKFTVTLK